MSGKQTHFFATKEDLTMWIQNIESLRNLQYAKSGLFDDPDPVVYGSFLDFEGLGINARGQATTGDISFIVLDKTTSVGVKTVPQVDGSKKYAIDVRANPASIDFSPSGFYDDNTLIAGNISTISTDSESIEIYSLFRKILLKNSTQVGYARVCTDALKFMTGGGRMVTMGIDSPPGYDLRFE